MNYLIKDFFSFPETINDVSARLVALFIVIITSVTIFFIMKESIIGIYFCFFLTYGFLARTLSGPKISPIALVVTKLMVPNLRLKEKLVPGPPKRFAQSIGLVTTAIASFCLLYNLDLISIILLAILLIFASLESFLGFCFGCKVFKLLMHINIIPQDVCEKCNNLEF